MVQVISDRPVENRAEKYVEDVEFPYTGVHVNLLEDILQSVHVGVVKYVVSDGLDLTWPESGSVEVDENSIVVCIDGPCDEVFVVEDTEVLCMSEGGSQIGSCCPGAVDVGHVFRPNGNDIYVLVAIADFLFSQPCGSIPRGRE